MTVLHWPMPGVVPGFRSGNKTRLFASTGVEGWLHDRISPYCDEQGRAQLRFQWATRSARSFEEGPRSPTRCDRHARRADRHARRLDCALLAGVLPPTPRRPDARSGRFKQDRITGLRSGANRRARWHRALCVGQRARTLRVVVELPRAASSAAVALISTNGTTLRKLLKAEFSLRGSATTKTRAELRKRGARRRPAAHALGDVQLRLRCVATTLAPSTSRAPCGRDARRPTSPEGARLGRASRASTLRGSSSAQRSSRSG